MLAFAILTANTDERAKISRAERERPPGARTWNGRAKRVQRGLLERWGLLYNVAVKPEPEAAAEPETQTAPEPDAEGEAEPEAVLEES